MCKIEKTTLEKAEKIYIGKELWGTEYTPEVYARVIYDEDGFFVEFTVCEKNPRREIKNHFDFVHLDSCVEFFVNFTPEKSDRYINFEANANGVMNAAFRKNRYEFQKLELKEIEDLGIKADIYDGYWTVSYKIGFDFIKKYYPSFDIDKCDYVIGNMYKCGEKTEYVHFISLFEVKQDKPDFHRPEFFGKFQVL